LAFDGIDVTGGPQFQDEMRILLPGFTKELLSAIKSGRWEGSKEDADVKI
jgi:hypothetical protein